MRPVIPRSLPETGWAAILGALCSLRPGAESGLRRRLGELCSAREVVLAGSARAVLYWILRALRPPRVYLPAYICASVWESVQRAGTPVAWLDLQPGTFDARLAGVDFEPGSVLLHVHHYGVPSDPGPALEARDRCGLVLVEDMAPALGATWEGRPVGSFGQAAMLSFEYTKVVSACRGGAAMLNDPQLARAVAGCLAAEPPDGTAATGMRWIRDALEGVAGDVLLAPVVFGNLTLPLFRRARGGAFVDRSRAVRLSGSYPMGFGMQRAALALARLERLPEILAGRRLVAGVYAEELSGMRDVSLVAPSPHAAPAYTHFPLLAPAGARERLTRELWARGVDPGFNFSYLCGGEEARRAAPVAADCTGRILTLPVSARLDESAARRVARAFRSAARVVGLE